MRSADTVMAGEMAVSPSNVSVSNSPISSSLRNAGESSRRTKRWTMIARLEILHLHFAGLPPTTDCATIRT